MADRLAYLENEVVRLRAIQKEMADEQDDLTNQLKAEKEGRSRDSSAFLDLRKSNSDMKRLVEDLKAEVEYMKHDSVKLAAAEKRTQELEAELKRAQCQPSPTLSTIQTPTASSSRTLTPVSAASTESHTLPKPHADVSAPRLSLRPESVTVAPQPRPLKIIKLPTAESGIDLSSDDDSVHVSLEEVDNAVPNTSSVSPSKTNLKRKIVAEDSDYEPGPIAESSAAAHKRAEVAVKGPSTPTKVEVLSPARASTSLKSQSLHEILSALDPFSFTSQPSPTDKFIFSRSDFHSNFGGGAQLFIPIIKAERSHNNKKLQLVFPQPDLNPFTIDGRGKPGLVFTSRPELLAHQPWYAFSKVTGSGGAKWEYCGGYKFENKGKMTKEQFQSMSEKVQKEWGKRVAVSWKSKKLPAYYDMGERVRKRVEKRNVDPADAMAAFASGQEHLSIYAMTCIEYDSTFVPAMRERFGDDVHGDVKPERKVKKQKLSGPPASASSGGLVRRSERTGSRCAMVYEGMDDLEDGDLSYDSDDSENGD